MKLLAALAAALLLVTACGEEQPLGSDPFGDGTWRLVGATVDGAPLVLVDDSPVTLRVTGGDVGGTAACNSYGGPITISDGVVTIGPNLIQTEMYCIDETVMTLEAAFLAALPRASTVGLENGQLLLTGEGVELRFDAVPPEPDAALVGTHWVLDTLVQGEAASTPAAPGDLGFAADGSVTGTTGCNSLFGDYDEVTGFGTIGATRMACEESIMAQEALVLSILGPNATLTIEGSLLTIADLEGHALVYRAGE